LFFDPRIENPHSQPEPVCCADAAEQLEQSRLELATFQQLNITETAAIPRRLETLTQVTILASFIFTDRHLSIIVIFLAFFYLFFRLT
jgi:hypothetical protein